MHKLYYLALIPTGIRVKVRKEVEHRGGQGHAEVTVINYAKANNVKIESVGASRPICFNCALTIQANGILAVTSLKPVPPLKPVTSR